MGVPRLVDEDVVKRIASNVNAKFAVNDGQLTAPRQLTNQNLDDYRVVDPDVSKLGFYYAAGGNTVSGKPSGVAHFGLYVVRAAAGVTAQILVDPTRNDVWVRCYDNGSWRAWTKQFGTGSTVPVANGGTGQTTAKGANYALMGYANDGGNNPDDNSLWMFQYVSPNASQGAMYTRKGANVWNWIVGKIRSTFGFSSSNVLPIKNGGTGATDSSSALSALGAARRDAMPTTPTRVDGIDMNEYRDDAHLGYYYGTGFKNGPNGLNTAQPYALQVVKTSGDDVMQLFTYVPGGDIECVLYQRYKFSGGANFGAWHRMFDDRDRRDGNGQSPVDDWNENKLISSSFLAYWNGAYDENGSSNLSRLGTVTKGVWNGSAVDVSHGGTGATTVADARSKLGVYDTATVDSKFAALGSKYATISSVEALEAIADAAVETWTGSGAPTGSNKPASDWTTAELRKRHAGDIYYDSNTGYAYRWGSSDNVNYSWTRISDSDITKALQEAETAQKTADSAASSASKANGDLSSFKTTAANTYATKTSVDTNWKTTTKTFRMTAGSATSGQWVRLGTLKAAAEYSTCSIRVFSGAGYNGAASQNSQWTIDLKRGNSASPATKVFGVNVTYERGCENVKVKAVTQSDANVCEIWCKMPWGWWSGSYEVSGYYDSWTHSGAIQTEEPSGNAQDMAEATFLGKETADSSYASSSAVQSAASDASSALSQIAQARFDIGTVRTLDTNEQATASLTGSGLNRVLDLGLPRGLPGPQGDPGPQGVSGVTSPSSGWFTLAVEDGILVAYANDSTPKFELDGGKLYYVID